MKQIIVNNISTSYYITEDGKCYNSNTNKWLKGQINQKSGYLSYNLTMPNGDKKRLYAHRLVAAAYIPNKYNKKQVNHIDGNKTNNNVYNLEWATQEENQQHALKLEMRKYKHVFCFNPDKELVAEYKTIAEASRATGISASLIQQELNKDIKALSGGFYWNNSAALGEVIHYKNNGKAKKVFQYDLNGKFITSYPSTGIAAKALHGNHSHISECCRGKIKTYKGFVWRYAEDIVSPSVKTEEI